MSNRKLLLTGAVHVHTRHSDGTGGVQELVAAARKLGLDFVVVADHDSLGLRESGGEGWHGDVLIAVGSEISTRKNMTHLLTLGHKSVGKRFEFSVDEWLNRVREKGGATLLAHANGQGLGGLGRDRRNWPWWDHPLLCGMEFWNYLQDWGKSFRLLEPDSYRLERIAERIQGPPDWLLRYWDQQAEKRPFAGICGSDNHAKRFWPFRRRYWPHEDILDRLVNHLHLDQPLPEDGTEAAQELMRALTSGRAIISRDELASGKDFSYCGVRSELPAEGGRPKAEGSSSKTGSQHEENPASGGAPSALGPRPEVTRHLCCGDTAPFVPGIRLVVESPVEAELRICRSGKVLASRLGKSLEFEPAGPGAYRAEGRFRGKAWVFTNHIRLIGRS